MAPFRIALTGDFLDERGQSAYGDVGLSLLDAERQRAEPLVAYRFLRDMAPQPGDADYWRRFYSLRVEPTHLDEIDGLIVLRPWVTRDAFARGARDLTVIGRSGAGYDKIDLAACTENDVALYNAPSALIHSTASTALLFMLALAKRLTDQERITRAGQWEKQAATMGDELQGRTLGIIGLGPSGRELARLAAPFSMRVLGYSRHVAAAQAAEYGIEMAPLDDVLQQADYVSLHARLSAETKGMIGRRELAMLKPSAYFINIARGALVDQSALVEALRERRIAGAGLDVFETEPLPIDDPLLKLENVIVTPHWSCSTSDVWKATGRAMAEGMLHAARGRVPDNVVNREVLDRPGFQAKLARFVRAQQ